MPVTGLLKGIPLYFWKGQRGLRFKAATLRGWMGMLLCYPDTTGKLESLTQTLATSVEMLLPLGVTPMKPLERDIHTPELMGPTAITQRVPMLVVASFEKSDFTRSRVAFMFKQRLH